jgi:hypothetical protein
MTIPPPNALPELRPRLTVPHQTSSANQLMHATANRLCRRWSYVDAAVKQKSRNAKSCLMRELAGRGDVLSPAAGDGLFDGRSLRPAGHPD